MNENSNKMTHIELLATWGLAAICSLRLLGMFIILPVLTTYGTSLKGANETLIGIAIGIYGFTQALFQIPCGLLSDRIGRKPMIVIGLMIIVLGSIIAAITDSIWGIILGRALQGSGAITAAIMALLSDLTREQNRTKAMAVIGIIIGITFFIAMIISPIITNTLGLNALFWMTTILASLGIAIILLIVPNPSNHLLNRESAIINSNIKTVFKNLKLLKLNISIFFLHILLVSNFVVLPNKLIEIGFPSFEHWKIYLVTMLISFLILVPIIVYAEKKRCIKQVLISSIILIIISQIMLSIVFNSYWIIVSLQLFFLSFNIMEVILPSLMSKESPVGYRGTAMGIYSTSQFLGMAIGGSMAGLIYDYLGKQSVFLVDVIIALIWFFISLYIQEPPYLSNLRIILNDIVLNRPNLEKYIQSQDGIISVLVIKEEKSAYIKIDNKITNRDTIEEFLNKC